MNIKASTQALYFLSKKLDRPLDKWSALKLIYFADRYHLRKYTRTITDDFYYAMENGPVASMTYDILKCNFNNEEEKNYVSNFLLFVNKKCKALDNEIELDNLSETDIEALDFAVKNFGNYSPEEIKEVSHKYPEWKKFEQTLKDDVKKRIEMSLLDFYNDPNDNALNEYPELKYDPFSIISKEILELSKEFYSGCH